MAEGELRIDPERMEVTVAGEPAELTPLEFKLLWTLAEGRDRALSRDEIFRRVWGGERAHGDRSVDVLVRRLRRKVDEVAGRLHLRPDPPRGRLPLPDHPPADAGRVRRGYAESRRACASGSASSFLRVLFSI